MKMKKILLKHVNILNGKKDMEVQKDMDILICDEIIFRIDKDIKVQADYQVIDLTGKYIVPGLINLHSHLPATGKVGKKKNADLKSLVKFITTSPSGRKIGQLIELKNARTELYSGVTTVRAVGGLDNFDHLIRNRINSRKVMGPRLLVSDMAIAPKDGHMVGTVSKEVNTNEEAIKLVKKAKKNKLDLVKIMITGGVLDCKEVGHPGDLKMSADMVKAICDEAHKLNMYVAAHVEGEEGAKIAILNGVDTIEHGSKVSEDLIKTFASRGGAQVLTISPALPLIELSKKETGYDEDATINSKVLLDNMIEMANLCLKNNCLLGLGTDTGCPYITHYDFWRELVYFTKYVKGVDNRFALYTATSVNATIGKVDNVTGTIEEGKCADLLVVDENPLLDLKALRNPYTVFMRGKQIKKKNKKYTNIENSLDSFID